MDGFGREEPPMCGAIAAISTPRGKADFNAVTSRDDIERSLDPIFNVARAMLCCLGNDLPTKESVGLAH